VTAGNSSLPSCANRLLIFAKAPRPGLAKTRLAAALGDETACGAYRVLLEALAAQLHEIHEAHPVTVCFAPEEAEAELRPFFPASWQFAPQRGAGLGERLADACARAFAAGAAKVLVIGADCPFVDPRDIAEGFAALERAPLVFGPATDGGYWLMGMSRLHAGVFEGIDWGTGAVLRQSLERAADLGLRAELLRTLADIDTAEDWFEYCRGRRLDNG